MKEAVDSESNAADPSRMNQIVFTVDLSGQFTYVNSACEHLLGYRTEQLLHMNLTEIVAPEQRDYVQQQITGSIDQPFGAVYEIEIVTESSRRMPVEMSTRVVMRDACAVELHGIALPLTGGVDLARPNRSRCLDERFTSVAVLESAILL
jgi:PAS domain S-box-containing protein